MSILKRKIVAMLLSIIAVAAISIPAFAESGSIYNFTTADNVVGVWVEVQGGKSGWATYTPSTNGVYSWSYDTGGKRYRVHIGLGGSPSAWEGKGYSQWINGNSDFSLYGNHRNPTVLTEPF